MLSLSAEAYYFGSSIDRDLASIKRKQECLERQNREQKEYSECLERCRQEEESDRRMASITGFTSSFVSSCLLFSAHFHWLLLKKGAKHETKKSFID